MQGKNNKYQQLPNEEIKQQKTWGKQPLSPSGSLLKAHKAATWISLPKRQQLFPNHTKKRVTEQASEIKL